MVVQRFEVYLVNLDATLGSKIISMRPCLVISPDEMNDHLATVTIVPMTTQARDYPMRINCRLQDKDGQVVLDQIRTVDKARLVKKLGKIPASTQKDVLAVLLEMFSK